MRISLEATQRIYTAIPLVGIAIAGTVYFSGISFVLLDTLLMLLIGWEWIRLLGYTLFWCWAYLTTLVVLSYLILYLPFEYILAFSMFMAVSLLLTIAALVNRKKPIDWPEFLLVSAGSAYLIINWQALIFLKGKSTLYLGIGLLNVILTDIMAYLVGKGFGTHHLPSVINVNKTWEGCLAGLVGPSIFILLLSQCVHIPFMTSPLGMTVMLTTSLTAIAGDLFESAIKRQRGVKDSGKGLPGHGGWLDRCDSLVCAMPVFAVGLFTCHVF